MSPKQAAAAEIDPGLEPMFKGSVIDNAAKKAAAADSRLQGVQATGPGKYGPDFVPTGSAGWWDITTAGQWANHVAKSGQHYGAGTPLFYK
jgi:hypothetical protein